MGREAYFRALRKEIRKQPAMRVVPTRRGVATIFATAAVFGLAVGLWAGFELVTKRQGRAAAPSSAPRVELVH